VLPGRCSPMECSLLWASAVQHTQLYFHIIIALHLSQHSKHMLPPVYLACIHPPLCISLTLLPWLQRCNMIINTPITAIPDFPCSLPGLL
jgi:hypothetical protein